MKHSHSSVALAVAAGLFSVAAQAGIHAVDCTGCTAAQVEALVPRCEQGVRYITDFAAARLYKGCYTLTGVEPRVVIHGGPTTLATKKYRWMQPSAATQNSFQTYLDVYNNNGHVRAQAARVYVRDDLTPKINLGGDDGYMNAYDAVRATANNDAVRNWLNSTILTSQRVAALPGKYPFSPALTTAIVTLLNSLDSSIISVDFNVKIEVVFHDGSTREYTVDKYGEWAAVPDSARDAHGNPIPETYDDVANNGGSQTYGFGGSGPDYDQGNFVHTITLFGIPIYGDTGATYGCSWNGSNNTLTCTKSR